MTTAKENHLKEIWKSPPSLKCPRVEVSNLGRMRTLDYERHFTRLGEKRVNRIKGKILSPAKDTRGRYIIGGGIVRKAWLGKCFMLHRLVAECFVHNPNQEGFKLVFFKNGNIADCRASNLEWGDRKDWGRVNRGRHVSCKIKVLCNGVEIGEYYGSGETARALGVTRQSVCQAMSRGILCKGFQLVKTSCTSQKPRMSVEDIRDKPQSRITDLDIPIELFTRERIDLKYKAVF